LKTTWRFYQELIDKHCIAALQILGYSAFKMFKFEISINKKKNPSGLNKIYVTLKPNYIAIAIKTKVCNTTLPTSPCHLWHSVISSS
jgi:hypothetical protein